MMNETKNTYESDTQKINKMISLAKKKLHEAIEKALDETAEEVLSEIKQDYNRGIRK